MSWALVVDGVVREIINADPAGRYHPSLDWVACETEVLPGWTYSGTTFIAPAVVAPTLAQQAAILLAGGLTLTSTGTPALNGVYAMDAAAISHIQAEIVSILTLGTFADGGATVAWADASGGLHVFPDVASFKLFAVAAAKFVAAAIKVQIGASTSLPAATAGIA